MWKLFSQEIIKKGAVQHKLYYTSNKMRTKYENSEFSTTKQQNPSIKT